MFEWTSPITEFRASLGTGQQGSTVFEFLEFWLAGEAYAVELAQIREIQSLSRVTQVPRAPEDVLGIFSVRGRLVTLIDLKRRLRLPHAPPTRSSRVLLTRTSDGEVIGMLVDDVRQVIRLSHDDIEVSQTVFGSDLSEHVLGIGRSGNEAVVLLNIKSIAE